MMHLNDKPFSMSQSVLSKVEFHPDLEAMVGRLLEKNPDLRYQSMEELQLALTRLQSGKALDRFKDTAPVRRINWQLVCIFAFVGALVTGALVMGAFDFWKKSAPLPKLRLASTSIFPDKPNEKNGSAENERLEIMALVREREPVVDLYAFGLQEITDSDMALLENATNANEIILRQGHINDLELDHIRQLKLEKLDLSRNDVKDLHALKRMTTLKVLNLEQTALDDAGLQVLAHLPNLQELNISKTGVSDSDLEYLADLGNLSLLKAADCSHITIDGLERFQRKMPACRIVSSLGMYEIDDTTIDLNPKLKEAEALQKAKRRPEAAVRFSEAATELRSAETPDLWLIVRCLKDRGECLLYYGNDRKLAIDLKAAKLAFAEAATSLEQAGQTLQKLRVIGAAGEKDKRKELTDIYDLKAIALEEGSDPGHALTIREQIIKLSDPSSIDLAPILNRVKMAIDFGILKQYNRAHALYKEAVSQYQKIGKEDSVECAQALHAEGDLYLFQGQWNEALLPYEQSISIVRKLPDVWKTSNGLRWGAAFCYYQVGRDADAEPLLKEFLQYEPDNKTALSLLAQLLTREHKPDEAARYAKLATAGDAIDKSKTQTQK